MQFNDLIKVVLLPFLGYELDCDKVYISKKNIQIHIFPIPT